METRKTDEVIWREDLYPRIQPNPTIIQQYATNVELLPPIEINQHNEIIDGYHRWTAHRKVEAETIPVTVTPTKSEAEFLQFAIERNAKHGLQLNTNDKKKMAIKLYAAGDGLEKEDIATTLSVTVRTINNYLHKIDKQLREERKERIFDLYLSCHTQEEIAQEVDVSRRTVSDELQSFGENGNLSNSAKTFMNFAEQDWKPPLYNVWSFGKLTNKVHHFGNSEEKILDRLLYLYTEPFDIVVDPFAGGGSTIDVCKRRLRRYWVSDRKPVVERENEIRKMDVTKGMPPLDNRWSDVSLTYLDPPYWWQAKGKYSDDPEDLANMELIEFTSQLGEIIKGIAEKQSKGAIAMLMQPTQWNAPGRTFTDHVFDLIGYVGNHHVELAQRVSTPYTTEQYNAQQVDWAKDNRELLVLTRELVIWEINDTVKAG